MGAQYLQHFDPIWELPTTRSVTGMLNEHGMQNAKLVVALAVNRNDDDDESEEASAEEHRSLRRRIDDETCYEPPGEVSGMSFKIGHHCVKAFPAISMRYAGARTEAAKQS